MGHWERPRRRGLSIRAVSRERHHTPDGLSWSLSWGRFFLGPRQRAALIRDRRLPRRQGQTISFDEHAVVFGLRPGKKADKHEGSAKHQPYQHHPTVRAFVVKIHDTHQ